MSSILQLLKILERILNLNLVRPTSHLLLSLWSFLRRCLARKPHPPSQPPFFCHDKSEAEAVTIYPARVLYPRPFIGPNHSQASDISRISGVSGGYSAHASRNHSRVQLSSQPVTPQPDRVDLPDFHLDPPEPEKEIRGAMSPSRTASPDQVSLRSRAMDNFSLSGKCNLSEVHPGFSPTTPEHVKRYDNRKTVPEESPPYLIQRQTTEFDKLDDRPGWKAYSHPEGARFFYHEGKRIFTDADLYDDNVVVHFTNFMLKIDDFMRTHQIKLPPDTDVVFDLVPDEDSEDTSILRCNYYFVSNRNRSIFWLDEFDAENFIMWDEIRGVTETSHVGHMIETLYWYHCSLFPTRNLVKRELVDEFRDILIHAITDTMTSASSTAPYNTSELQQMLTIANNMRKCPDAGLGTAASLSRLMYLFVQQRFYNFHGQPSARLDRDQSVYQDNMSLHRSPLITFLSPFLFNSPDVHLRALHKMWTDRILHINSWLHLINKLNNEWQEFILFGTVLLTANVGFLAIQSIDEQAEPPSRSSAQLSSYISVATSLGCIIIGLLLTRQNRTKTRETAQEASEFLTKQSHPARGLETLAILYSLPYALLMWGMLSFLAAISFMIYENTDLTVRLVTGAAWLAVCILIVWCIYTSWETRPGAERNFVHTFFAEMWERAENVLFFKPETDSDSDSVERKKKFRLSWELFQKRKTSYDSGETVVGVRGGGESVV